MEVGETGSEGMKGQGVLLGGSNPIRAGNFLGWKRDRAPIVMSPLAEIFHSSSIFVSFSGYSILFLHCLSSLPLLYFLSSYKEHNKYTLKKYCHVFSLSTESDVLTYHKDS